MVFQTNGGKCGGKASKIDKSGRKHRVKNDFWLIDSRLHAELGHGIWSGNSNPDQSYGISNNWREMKGEMWGKISKNN